MNTSTGIIVDSNNLNGTTIVDIWLLIEINRAKIENLPTAHHMFTKVVRPSVNMW